MLGKIETVLFIIECWILKIHTLCHFKCIHSHILTNLKEKESFTWIGGEIKRVSPNFLVLLLHLVSGKEIGWSGGTEISFNIQISLMRSCHYCHCMFVSGQSHRTILSYHYHYCTVWLHYHNSSINITYLLETWPSKALKSIWNKTVHL